MAEIITCPECQRKLQVPESFFGQQVQCPECAHQFVANPHSESVQATPPVAASRAPARSDSEDSPRRRRESYDDDFDDEFDDRRPLRRAGMPHRGGVILALGIIALVIPAAGVICGPMAWIMGSADLAEIRAGRMDPSGEGMVQAGRVLGIVATIIFLGLMLLFCLGCGMGFVTRR